ncbi:hypothetical protein [Cupriavidus sp. YR651]|uniref:hypothetical protein n=1 Tax=Cupriavidus sp. YR651 TaxID=1855315 RepID=UPI00115FC31B|nr:hypothetical protein [Cupriavidus sp. YR651]
MKLVKSRWTYDGITACAEKTISGFMRHHARDPIKNDIYAYWARDAFFSWSELTAGLHCSHDFARLKALLQNDPPLLVDQRQDRRRPTARDPAVGSDAKDGNSG